VVSGSAIGSSTAVATTGVGGVTITGSTANLTATNYDFTSADSMLTIDKAHLTVTANNQSRLYGATNPTFSQSFTGFVNGQNASVVTGAALGSSTAVATTGVGNVAIRGSTIGLAASNYDFAPANGLLTIAKAHLTVTADNQSRFFGAPNPPFIQTITGFANGENTSVVIGTAFGSSTANSATPVGSVTITGSTIGLAAVNYDFAVIDGLLTIEELLATASKPRHLTDQDLAIKLSTTITVIHHAEAAPPAADLAGSSEAVNLIDTEMISVGLKRPGPVLHIVNGGLRLPHDLGNSRD
jgi:hypothetical protein